MSLLSISRSKLFKVVRQKAIFIVFLGWRFYPSPTLPLGSDNSLLKKQINQHEERPVKEFYPEPSMNMASSHRYRKLISNGFDLVELKPKPVDHRQNRIYPLVPPYTVRYQSVKIPAKHQTLVLISNQWARSSFYMDLKVMIVWKTRYTYLCYHYRF
jgi:hypothetical protein